MKLNLIIIILTLFISCNNKSTKPNFYKNLFTGEILSENEFKEFKNSLITKHGDSTDKTNLTLEFFKVEKHSDSVIQNFKYSLRIGDNYIIRSRKFEKIGMKVLKHDFTTIHGEKISLGGIQDKPTLINLWFINCPGCIAEMPALNSLKEKYSDKVNFVSLTFEKENNVLKFLKKRKFEFTHIANAEIFIKQIGSYPYPENIFVDKNGYIRNIEGPLPSSKHKDGKLSAKYFEDIIEKLLK